MSLARGTLCRIGLGKRRQTTELDSSPAWSRPLPDIRRGSQFVALVDCAQRTHSYIAVLHRRPGTPAL
jgi:hypothetical protein